jgi:DNA-binding transcriptional regulator PaaX
MNFIKKYPLTAREAVCTPLILRDGFFKNNPLPYPSLKGIRDFTEYCGISYSAVRTGLSRLHNEGIIRIFKDDKKVTRYQMTESSMNMGKATSDRQNLPEGFIIAIFSFTKEEDTERARVRETLKYYGFKKLAQNTYINGRIETESLKKTMREFGLERNLYLFHCPNIDDIELIEKILSVFEIEKRNKFLHEFYKDLTSFLFVKNLDVEEIIHRLYFSGPVHWKICFMDEPPFPLKYLPKDYLLNALIRFYTEFLEKYKKDFIDHFKNINR